MDDGFKNNGYEFVYPGTTRLIFSENGLIDEHRDYFDFMDPPLDLFPFWEDLLDGFIQDLSHKNFLR